MKRVRHILLAIARWTSLALLAVAVAGWVRSYFVYDMISLVRDRQSGNRFMRRIWSVRSCGGGLMLEYISSDSPADRFLVESFDRDAGRRGWNWDRGLRSGYPWRFSTYPERTLMHRLGFEWGDGGPHAFGSSTVYTPSLTFGYWFAVLLGAMLPGQWLVARLRRRAREGCCPRCGYDLRASPERCPECGLVTALTPRGSA